MSYFLPPMETITKFFVSSVLDIILCFIGVRISNLVPSAMCQQFRQETLESAFDRGFKGAQGKENCEVPPSTYHTVSSYEFI